jgi:hypothetical protein
MMTGEENSKTFYRLVGALVPPSLVLAAIILVAVLTRGTGNSLGDLTVFGAVQ